MISVIIPVFNTSREQLIRCLNSIINQDYGDYEIIIVDDGCLYITNEEFCELEDLDKRITIIHQPNQGVSAARNEGIKISRGEYISFVDGDDEIDSRFLVESSAIAEKYNADLIVGTIQFVKENSHETVYENDVEYVYEGAEIKTLRRSLLQLSPRDIPYIIFGSSSARLIKKQLLDTIRFDEKITMHEDQIFNRELLLAANKAVYIHHVWYLYYQYENSSLHEYRRKYSHRAILLNCEYLKKYNQVNLIEPDINTRQEMLQQSIWEFTAAISFHIINNHSNESKSTKKKQIVQMYDYLEMQDVVKLCEYKRINKSTIKMLYILLKFKKFNALYLILKIYYKLKNE